MVDFNKYLIPTPAEEGILSDLKVKVSNIKISSKIKDLWNKLLGIFKKQKEEVIATEGIGDLFRKSSSGIDPKRGISSEMEDKVVGWISDNISRIHSKDDPNFFHIDASDGSEEMQIAITIMNQLKVNGAWEHEVPLMILSYSDRKTKKSSICALLRASWNSQTVIAVGIPVVSVNKPFSKILEELKTKGFSKVEAGLYIEFHWEIKDPTKIDTSDTGSNVLIAATGNIEFESKN